MQFSKKSEPQSKSHSQNADGSVCRISCVALYLFTYLVNSNTECREELLFIKIKNVMANVQRYRYINP
jgi:hypothetical protein